MSRPPSLAIIPSLVIAAVLAATASAATKPIRVTFVGDSMPASIEYVPSAQRVLREGLNVRLDLKVCRRLVQPSCAFLGSTPSTTLQAVQSYGRSLGHVLVVSVGYNESERGYGAGIDRVIRAALAQGVKGVVWVTLREQRDIYRRTNVAIRSAAGRWPQMQVADWHDYSAGKPWFRDDGLHMGITGANAFAAFLRPYIFRAAS
ncbi:MAG: hypothetical protein M3Q67_05855 [Actinomycetota bacterium]|nr:hypothetical protein [Actinomycetota bacterium]